MNGYPSGTLVSFEDVSGADNVPAESNIEQWVQQVLTKQLESTPFPELSIQVVDEQTITELNETYRHKSGPTNVLSFPFDAPPRPT